MKLQVLTNESNDFAIKSLKVTEDKYTVVEILVYKDLQTDWWKLSRIAETYSLILFAILEKLPKFKLKEQNV